MRSRGWILALTVVGVGLTVAGLWVTRSAMAHGVGWFAYSPLTDRTSPRLFSTREVVGWVVAACGLVVVSGVVGYTLGSRGRHGPGRPPE